MDRGRALRSQTLRIVVAAFSTLALSTLGQIWRADYAWASCGGSSIHDAAGADGAFVAAYGDKASVYVNSFANSQYQTWRAVGAFRNSNNFAEVGWYIQESDFNQRAHPYNTWVSDGVLSSFDYYFSDVPQSGYQMFNLNDKNNDKYWSFFWAGNQLGSNEYVNMSGPQAIALTESERYCTNDSLLAHFNSLQFIKTVNGPWMNYTNLAYYIDTTTDWNVCLRTVTSYDVQMTC
jgi:hypothetical protein